MHILLKASLASLLMATLPLTSAMSHDAPKQEIKTYKDKIVNFAKEQIKLVNPFARQGKKGQNSAAFVEVRNLGGKDQAIIKATSPVANIIELHTSTEENGVHKMRPVQEIVAPAQGAVHLKSGGYHVMLIDLKEDLVVGQQIPVTLELEGGDTLEMTYEVKGCCGSCH